jgi:hypothetical protein
MKIDKIGTDIEFVLYDENCHAVSALYFLKGTKENPERMLCMRKDFAFMNDNVLLEINVPPVDIHSKNVYKEFNDNIKIALEYVTKRLPVNIRIAARPGEYYSDKDLQNPLAKILGCDRDFNIWTMSPNPKPDASSNFRGCGFHIHLSYDDPTTLKTEKFMKLFDIVITSALIACEENELKRRSFYGKAGAFRFTKYGFEARTLSSIHVEDYEFIIDNLLWIEKFFDVISNTDIEQFEEEVVFAINNCILNIFSAQFKELVQKKNPDIKYEKQKKEVKIKKINRKFGIENLVSLDRDIWHARVENTIRPSGRIEPIPYSPEEDEELNPSYITNSSNDSIAILEEKIDSLSFADLDHIDKRIIILGEFLERMERTEESISIPALGRLFSTIDNDDLNFNYMDTFIERLKRDDEPINNLILNYL